MDLKLAALFFLLVLQGQREVEGKGCLYHRDSETRNSISLDGLWNFALSNTTDGVPHLDVRKMPVPSSYNDFSADSSLRDYVGVVWYDHKFHVPKSWKTERVWIRFSSVCYGAQVWINGQMAVTHIGGHVPFQAEITSLVKFGKKNKILVSVDNILSQTTIPQGQLGVLNSGRIQQNLNFDYFNYAGIDRPVVIYTTPNTYIDDITIDTDIDISNNGVVNFDVSVIASTSYSSRVTLIDKDENEILSSISLKGSFVVANPKLWWPYLMDPNPGYLYSIRVEIFDVSNTLVDTYVHRVGIRKIKWDATTFTINGRPLYFRGFGRHQDNHFRGRGLDYAAAVRDHNLMKWIGANGYRTSHFPYSEEEMDLADELGIMIINESPATGLTIFSEELLVSHKQSITELIQRDKNRPSVIMWSVASEASASDVNYAAYIKQVFDHVRTLDTKRAVTIVTSTAPETDVALQYVDVCLFNLYSGWSSNPGDLDTVVTELTDITIRYHQHTKGPVMIAEYGSETEQGSHSLPVNVWSEDYQSQLLSVHFQGFDKLRSQGFFMGEMISSFADYECKGSSKKNRGKKGIFERDRKPKAAAKLLRKRFWQLAKNLDKVQVPNDIYEYVFVSSGSTCTDCCN